MNEIDRQTETDKKKRRLTDKAKGTLTKTITKTERDREVDRQ